MWKVLFNRLSLFLVKLIAESVIEKAKKIQNNKVEVVYFSIKDKMLFVESKTLAFLSDINDESFYNARLRLGQNCMMVYGPIVLAENPITYVLIPRFSVLKLGLRYLYRQLKEWKGQSCFGAVPVVFYKTFWSF
jgi:hypothetical protein